MVWENFIDKSFPKNGRSSNASGRNWIDLKSIRAMKEMTYAE